MNIYTAPEHVMAAFEEGKFRFVGMAAADQNRPCARNASQWSRCKEPATAILLTGTEVGVYLCDTHLNRHFQPRERKA